MIKYINKRFKLLACLCLVCVLLGFLGKYYWFLDLFSHFRLQYVLFFVAASFIFLLCRNMKWAIYALVCSTLLGAKHIQYQLGSPEVSSAPKYKVMSYNLNSSNDGYDKVIDFISKESPDIAFLMEVNSVWDARLKDLETEFPYIIQHPKNDNFGFNLYSKRKIISSNIEYFNAIGVPSVVADIEFDGNAVRFIGTHPVPPVSKSFTQSRNRQLSNVGKFIRNSDSEYLIVVGDLNLTPWSHVFSKFVKQGEIYDASLGHGIGGTWMRNSIIFSIPIDHVFGNENVEFLNKKILENFGSDHNPVLFEFKLVDQQVAGNDAIR